MNEYMTPPYVPLGVLTVRVRGRNEYEERRETVVVLRGGLMRRDTVGFESCEGRLVN